MPRFAIPLVEVTAPDGAKSFWAAYSIPHREAVAAVRDRIPPDHLAELSGRRLPPGWKFAGAHPGDVIKLSHEFDLRRRTVRSVSARSASLPWAFAGAAMDDLDEMAAQLLDAVRKMPPGQKRQDALREIGRLRSRMHALLRSTSNSKRSPLRKSGQEPDLPEVGDSAGSR